MSIVNFRILLTFFQAALIYLISTAKMNEIQDWIAEAPKYSSFRVNTLKKFDPDILEMFLETVSKPH